MPWNLDRFVDRLRSMMLSIVLTFLSVNSATLGGAGTSLSLLFLSIARGFSPSPPALPSMPLVLTTFGGSGPFGAARPSVLLPTAGGGGGGSSLIRLARYC